MQKSARKVRASVPQRSVPSPYPVSEEEVAALRSAVLAKLTLDVGKNPDNASDRDWFVASALAIRDRIVFHWVETNRRVQRQAGKRVYYLSLEFLIGRLLRDFVHAFGLSEALEAALGDLGVKVERMFQAEPDAALGNGGLGRLAACFMESMATLAIPAFGYGIRYDHGLFRQVIKNGEQQEYPEDWLSFGNPWEFERPEIILDIGFGGLVELAALPGGGTQAVWHPAETVEAVAYDTPIVGWRAKHVNPLRLWSARAVDPLRLDVFNSGDHVGALYEQTRAEAISKILYPADATAAGQELRLRQEYFFVSASLQDLVRRHIRVHGDIRSLPGKAAIQLNDTHPSVALAELVRLLVDVHGIPFDEAWDIAVRTFSYTNHTLLPEALETWPVPLFERLLPRHMQIIFHINARHLDHARSLGLADDGYLASVSMIDERDGRRVRMGHLAFIGSHRVNGVSGLHTELMKTTVFRDLDRLYPGRIVNETNGITLRRWLHQANPRLTALLAESCGSRVFDDPDLIRDFDKGAEDAATHEAVAAIRLANKIRLERLIRSAHETRVDPRALFDVQIKRVHEYKRQLLNLLETIALYDAIRAEPARDWTPRVKIFAGKAAATYQQAKLIIRLAHDVAARINNDPLVRDLLKVVFMPNYNVSLAAAIIPAADLSEQISTAGMEASGTGNMKLALNGALTIGTFDGANIEISEHVGRENMFIFGLSAGEVSERWAKGFNSPATIQASPLLRDALAALSAGNYAPGDPGRYGPIVGALYNNDRFMVTADFDAYWAAQRRVEEVWRDPKAWWRTSIHNTARMAWFSSDRAIRGYAADIWTVPAPGVLPPD